MASEREKKGINGKKIMLVALGVGVVGTAAFFAIKKTSSSPDDSGSDNIDPAPTPVKKKISLFSKKKSLPSKGTSQSNTTLPATADNSDPASSEPFVPKDLAKSLLDSGEQKNLPGVISILKKMKNTSDYWLVNNIYKTLRWWGNKTIVTDLLESDFKDDENAKALIRKEFLRMGLKQDSATQKWSLSGFRIHNDIITLKNTYVADRQGNRIAVKKNTILGEEIAVSNGMTWFKAVDGTIGSVPAKDVRYA